MKGTVCKDSSLFIVRAVVGICSGCTIFSYSNCIAAFRASGQRHRGARPSQGPSTDRPCRSRSRPAKRRLRELRRRSVWGVESAQPFLAGDQQRRVVAAIGDQPHRFAHQLAGQPPAAEFGSPSPRRRYRSCGPAGFRTAAGGASPPCGLVFGREHAAAAVVAYQERADELFVVAEGRGPQLFAGDFVGVSGVWP